MFHFYEEKFFTIWTFLVKMITNKNIAIFLRRILYCCIILWHRVLTFHSVGKITLAVKSADFSTVEIKICLAKKLYQKVHKIKSKKLVFIELKKSKNKRLTKDKDV